MSNKFKQAFSNHFYLILFPPTWALFEWLSVFECSYSSEREWIPLYEFLCHGAFLFNYLFRPLIHTSIFITIRFLIIWSRKGRRILIELRILLNFMKHNSIMIMNVIRWLCASYRHYLGKHLLETKAFVWGHSSPSCRNNNNYLLGLLQRSLSCM